MVLEFEYGCSKMKGFTSFVRAFGLTVLDGLQRTCARIDLVLQWRVMY